jgi:long-chain fatty acid transport protein
MADPSQISDRLIMLRQAASASQHCERPPSTQRDSLSAIRLGFSLIAIMAVSLVLLGFLAGPAEAQLRPANSGNFAAADSAATAYSNPAGMIRLDRTEVVLDTLLGYSKSEFKVSSATTASGGNGDPNDNFFAIPSFYIVAPALHERLRFGASLNIPSGFGSDYGNNWAGRYVATESSLVYVALNGSVAVRVTDWLSLGGGLQVLYTKTTSKAKINNLLEGLPDGRVKFEASGIGVGGVISALLQVDRIPEFARWIGRDMPLRLGLTYRPKTETDIDGVPELDGVGPLLGAALIANGIVAKSVDLKTTSPQMVGFGIYVEPVERLSVTFDFVWIDMEQFGSVEVSVSDFSTTTESDYRDTYGTAVSIGWQLTEEVQLLTGFGYLTSAIADSKRSLSLPIDRIYVIGVGTKYRPLDWFEFNCAFNYYDTGDSHVDTEPTNRSGRIVGKSSPHYALGFNLGMTFRF